ncbi:hypothetical protein ACFRJ3_32465 [Streptomyces sp. NPDC056696]|uniref:hypothetical protein n=1 Tax=Streptomyces sp. NPDC056696 TaxID=3345914 RepID=UPI0036CA446D
MTGLRATGVVELPHAARRTPHAARRTPHAARHQSQSYDVPPGLLDRSPSDHEFTFATRVPASRP